MLCVCFFKYFEMAIFTEINIDKYINLPSSFLYTCQQSSTTPSAIVWFSSNVSIHIAYPFSYCDFLPQPLKGH